MSELSQSGSPKAATPWFAGDRRLYCLAGPLAREGQDNPEQLAAGSAVQLPRAVRRALGIDDHLKFTLSEIRRFAFGSMGFCEVEGQPGRGAWIRMHHLTRVEWHTPLGRPRSQRRDGC
jgi:hypothetical protein